MLSKNVLVNFSFKSIKFGSLLLPWNSRLVCKITIMALLRKRWFWIWVLDCLTYCLWIYEDMCILLIFRNLDSDVASTAISKTVEACLVALWSILSEIFSWDPPSQSINDYLRDEVMCFSWLQCSFFTLLPSSGSTLNSWWLLNRLPPHIAR